MNILCEKSQAGSNVSLCPLNQYSQVASQFLVNTAIDQQIVELSIKGTSHLTFGEKNA